MLVICLNGNMNQVFLMKSNVVLSVQNAEPVPPARFFDNRTHLWNSVIYFANFMLLLKKKNLN